MANVSQEPQRFNSQLLDDIVLSDLGCSSLTTTNDPVVKVKSLISQFNHQNRVSSGDGTFNIFNHLYTSLASNPHLRDICLSIVSTPCTSASVERCFSVLKITLTHLRNRLKDTNIENSMLLHCNFDLLSVINFDEINV